MNNDIIPILAQEIAAQILRQPGRELGPDEPLISGGIIDSFSLVDLALVVENNFGVYIDDTELNTSTFDTLRELAELIHARRT
ncbi:MAG: acyl carrier protein [Chloroflexi bacterium]|nr:acyl carrier protein [Chloroflexota bacterium]